ncbi:ANR family transcriptional regulator [Testudinibacter sp. P27/CKL/0425]
MSKEELNFKAVSELASEVERSGDYDYATSLWQKASKLARKSVNADWCAKRVEFLNRWAARLRGAKQ